MTHNRKSWQPKGAREYRIVAKTRRLERKLRRRMGKDFEPPLRYRLFIATHPNAGLTEYARRALAT